MSWLSSLPGHPIFTLPDPALVSTSSTATLQQPQRVDFTAPTTPQGRSNNQISQSTSTRSLFGSTAIATSTPPRPSPSTPSRPLSISTPSSRSRQPQPTPRQHVEQLNPSEGSQNQRMVLVRGTDLIVAVGRELRVASLAEVKAKALGSKRTRGEQNGRDEDLDLGDYKVLNTPVINFDIRQLVLNPTSKLLAVVGVHSVCVIDLPRKGWTSSISRTIDCRCLVVGKFYHSLPHSPPVAQALWHPLGHDASSLLILTNDSTLREYSIGENVEEPAQTLVLSESRPTSSSSTGMIGGSAKKEKKKNGGFGFSAEDEDSSIATGMCIGEGEGDWGRMTLYALMKSGDVVAVCPFLPKRASIPKSYLEALSCFVSTKLDYLSSTSSSKSSALVAPHTPSRPSALSRSTDAPSLPTDSSVDLEKRYTLQMQYLHALLRQIPPPNSPTSPSFTSTRDEKKEEFVTITAPTSRPALEPIRQGPFLMQPSTIELDNGIDSFATDLLYVSTGGAEEGRERVGGGGLGVVLIVYSDGKLEVCLEVEKVEARFGGEKRERPVTRQRRIGYGSSTMDDDEEEEDLPSLIVYETVDLGFSTILADRKEDEAKTVWPTLVQDPLYGGDTVYIYHELGVQGFVLGKGISDVWDAVQGGGVTSEENKVREGVRKTLEEAGEDESSEVFWIVKTQGGGDRSGEEEEGRNPPIVGLSVINDVYLGYSLLAITPLLQVVAVELSLRVDPDLLPSTSSSLPLAASTSTKKQIEPPAYISLLETPFSIPAVLSKRPSQPPRPLQPVSKSGTGGEDVKVTPDSLRQLGKHVETYQSSIRSLVEGVDAVQHRLELQMKELSRQLAKVDELNRLSGDLRASTSASVGPGSASTTLAGRMAKVEKNQVELLERLDRVLQKLMERHQGTDQVSTFEKKWFDELSRLERQVKGGGSGGLEGRAERVEAMWNELRPDVEDLAERKKERERAQQRERVGNGELGQGQIKGLEGKLAEESRLIADAKKKVERLTSALAGTSL